MKATETKLLEFLKKSPQFVILSSYNQGVDWHAEIGEVWDAAPLIRSNLRETQ